MQAPTLQTIRLLTNSVYWDSVFVVSSGPVLQISGLHDFMYTSEMNCNLKILAFVLYEKFLKKIK